MPDFSGQDLTGARFEDVRLRDAVFRSVDLGGAVAGVDAGRAALRRLRRRDLGEDREHRAARVPHAAQRAGADAAIRPDAAATHRLTSPAAAR